MFYFGEDVDVYKGGKVVDHEGAWLSGVDGARFGRRVSRCAQDHLRADSVMAGLIDRLGPVKLRARRLPPI